MTHDTRNTLVLFYNAIDGNFLIDHHWQYEAIQNNTGQYGLTVPWMQSMSRCASETVCTGDQACWIGGLVNTEQHMRGAKHIRKIEYLLALLCSRCARLKRPYHDRPKYRYRCSSLIFNCYSTSSDCLDSHLLTAAEYSMTR